MPKEKLVVYCPKCHTEAEYVEQTVSIRTQRIVGIEAMYDINQYVARTEENCPMFNIRNYPIQIPDDESGVEVLYQSWYKCSGCGVMLDPLGSFLRAVPVEDSTEEETPISKVESITNIESENEIQTGSDR